MIKPTATYFLTFVVSLCAYGQQPVKEVAPFDWHAFDQKGGSDFYDFQFVTYQELQEGPFTARVEPGVHKLVFNEGVPLESLSVKGPDGEDVPLSYTKDSVTFRLEHGGYIDLVLEAEELQLGNTELVAMLYFAYDQHWSKEYDGLDAKNLDGSPFEFKHSKGLTLYVQYMAPHELPDSSPSKFQELKDLYGDQLDIVLITNNLGYFGKQTRVTAWDKKYPQLSFVLDPNFRMRYQYKKYLMSSFSFLTDGEQVLYWRLGDCYDPHAIFEPKIKAYLRK
ncbi:hypothetical protein [Marinoscillum sp.]|uniref:hypothetical protein n=1 Tax=Marinoscillum sp. TaxID=2024838 RepID=UPI003BAC9C07